MKKITFFSLFLLTFELLHAQDYMISFSATGASSNLSTVKIDNLTKGVSVSMNGNDILHLGGTSGFQSLKANNGKQIVAVPNPMNDFCAFEFETVESGLTLIDLYDVSGKMILAANEQLSVGEHLYNLSGLKSGIYLLKITTGQKIYTSKIVSVNNENVSPEIKHISSTLNLENNISLFQKSPTNPVRIVDLPYSVGDNLLVKGTDGIFNSYSVLDPTISTSVIIVFISSIDFDGISYPITKIGGQWWMAENLRSTKFNDGVIIPTDLPWINNMSPACCTYNNTSNNDTINTYGRLYNWHAVNTGKLCPKGWHVATHADWTLLKDYSGGTLAGGKLKATGTTNWLSPNQGATNLFGFNALPGGWRSGDGIFNFMGKYGFYWTSTEAGTSNAKMWSMEYNNEYLMSDPSNRSNGFCVRCILD